MGADDDYLEVIVAERVANLVQGPHAGENGEAGHEGNISAGSQAGCHANHVLLRDAAVKMSLRKRLDKGPKVDGTGDIGFYDYDFFIGLAQLGKPVTHCYSICYHFSSPPSSFIACSYCSLLGTAPCHL